MAKSRWYNDGYIDGVEAAKYNIAEPSARRELVTYAAEDRIGEFAGEVREHQSQMAGDIVYEVGRKGGPTESQFEKWEQGFYDGFIKTVEAWYVKQQRTLFNRRRLLRARR